MRKISVDNMLSGRESRYALVIGVAKRARQISERLAYHRIVTEEKPVLLAIEDFKNHRVNLLAPEETEEE
ncbi:MAG: DNA-directed RNA polymerase subunit omega [Ruminococcus sp.]|nr:DNA-directed RNA polymerase subunit omega [Ruminococcus sp.]